MSVRWCWVLGVGLGLTATLSILYALGFFSVPGPPSPVVDVEWMFEPPERGAILSSPRVDGDSVYVAAVEDTTAAGRGAVYSLNRQTGKPLWKFTDDGAMQRTYSSPCLDDGRLYIGEGMHANFVCKLYCLDKATGRKLWQFQTAGHIESSPCVADGQVFFGSGDDGLYCLDARTGVKRWHFQGDLHVDSSPAVAGGRVYAASGSSQKYGACALLCLDAQGGELLWKVPVDLPVWGSPAVDGEQVFFGLGNGRLLQSAQPPARRAGALVCVHTDTGALLWRYDTADAVFARAALNGKTVCFGSRDGHAVCLDRRDGRPHWSVYLGSPIITRPALLANLAYFVTSAGVVYCLDAEDGKEKWSLDLGERSRTQPQVASSPCVVADTSGVTRLYVGTELRNAASSAAVLFAVQWKSDGAPQP